jgi:hypothetical protein
MVMTAGRASGLAPRQRDGVSSINAEALPEGTGHKNDGTIGRTA